MLLIRNAKIEDLKTIVEIEATCFPEAEAAKESSIKERLEVYSKGFFVGELEGQIIGFINGGASDDALVEDEFF